MYAEGHEKVGQELFVRNYSLVYSPAKDPKQATAPKSKEIGIPVTPEILLLCGNSKKRLTGRFHKPMDSIRYLIEFYRRNHALPEPQRAEDTVPFKSLARGAFFRPSFYGRPAFFNSQKTLADEAVYSTGHPLAGQTYRIMPGTPCYPALESIRPYLSIDAFVRHLPGKMAGIITDGSAKNRELTHVRGSIEEVGALVRIAGGGYPANGIAIALEYWLENKPELATGFNPERATFLEKEDDILWVNG